MMGANVTIPVAAGHAWQLRLEEASTHRLLLRDYFNSLVALLIGQERKYFMMGQPELQASNTLGQEAFWAPENS